MTVDGLNHHAPHAMQSQTTAPQQQQRAHGVLTALAGAQIGGGAPVRQSAGAPIAMKMPR
jgi:hypothetical protein